MTVDFNTLWQGLDKGGVVFLFAMFTFAIVKGWLVPKISVDKMEGEYVRQITKMETEIGRLTEIAFRQTVISERSVSLGERLVQKDKG